MGLGFGPQGRGLRPERPDLRPERPDLRPERPVLRPDRLDLRPDEGGDEQTNPLCSTGLRPLQGHCPKTEKIIHHQDL